MLTKLSSVPTILPLATAFTMALTWTYFTRDMYNYNMGFTTIYSISLFPLLAWTAALTVGYSLAWLLLRRFNVERRPLQLAIVILFYIIAVIIAETIGYHAIGIQNIGTSQYIGLPLCDCLHAPLWMQAGYFLMGPLHWLVTRGVTTMYHMIPRVAQ